MSRRAARALLASVALTLLACAATRSGESRPPRPAPAAPESFLVATPSGLDAPRDGGACGSPLVDPGDGARLFLVRSAGGEGDYAVPPGKYGAAPGELLRVRCADGRPLGLVPR